MVRRTRSEPVVAQRLSTLSICFRQPVLTSRLVGQAFDYIVPGRRNALPVGPFETTSRPQTMLTLYSEARIKDGNDQKSYYYIGHSELKRSESSMVLQNESSRSFTNGIHDCLDMTRRHQGHDGGVGHHEVLDTMYSKTFVDYTLLVLRCK